MTQPMDIVSNVSNVTYVIHYIFVAISRTNS